MGDEHPFTSSQVLGTDRLLTLCKFKLVIPLQFDLRRGWQMLDQKEDLGSTTWSFPNGTPILVVDDHLNRNLHVDLGIPSNASLSQSASTSHLRWI